MCVSMKLELRFLTGLCITTLLSSFGELAIAEEAEFADDFSKDSIRYTVESDANSTMGNPVSIHESRIRLETTNDGSSDYSETRIRLQEESDTLIIRGAIGPTLSQATSDAAQVRLSVSAQIYNDTVDFGDQNGAGDIFANIGMYHSRSFGTGVFYCLNRNDGMTSTALNIIDGSNCGDFDAADLQLATDYTLGLSLDRQNKVLRFHFADQTRDVKLPGNVYQAHFAFREFALTHEGGAGFAEASVAQITSDSGVDTITSQTIVGRYRPIYTAEINNASAAVSPGKLRLSIESGANENLRLLIKPFTPSDYHEATFLIDPQSSVSAAADARFNVEFDGALYNDTAENGFNGREGNVHAGMYVQLRGNGQAGVSFCLRRENDAEGQNLSSLLGGYPDCPSFLVRVEKGKVYRMAVALDRADKSVTFRFDGQSFVQAIDGAIFAVNPENEMTFAVLARDGARAEVDLLELRTSPVALTSEEIASGATAPEPFPAPVDAAALQVDSALDNLFDFSASRSFFDDFSVPQHYGFWGGQTRGQSGVRYTEKALELQTNSTQADKGNYTEFYISGATDTIAAQVSLSSETLLPPTADAAADIRVQGNWYNDTQDYGLNDREGDIYAELGLQLLGDGRRQVRAYVGRRNADGNTDGYGLFDGEDSFVFADLIPVLDTAYTLSIELDREGGFLTFKAGELAREVSLPTQVFLAAQDSKQIQVSHRGSSGRAVGRLYSISTDTFSDDFSVATPLLAPYRPNFDAYYPGRELEYSEGRMRFAIDNNVYQGHEPTLVVLGRSDYVGADVEISSQSVTTGIERVAIGVGATLYNDLTDGGTNGSEGSVFAFVNIVLDGTDGLFAEYCAYRSMTSDFSESTDLIQGDPDNCSRFTEQPAPDRPYAVSVALDRSRSVIVFVFNGDTREYQIATDIHAPDSYFSSLRARSRDGGNLVAYADNFSLSANPVPIARSTDRLLNDGVTSRVKNDKWPGCSIAGSGDRHSDPTLPVSVVISLILLYSGRRRRLL